MRRLPILVAAILLASAAITVAQSDIEPARFVDGSLPSIPPLAVAGGQVMLSVGVSSTGAVTTIEVLRSTPPFTDSMVTAVKTWRFSPALDQKRKPMDTRVLVGASISSPGFREPTLGTPPKDVSTSDARVPFPAQTAPAPYIVNARSGGTVVVESRIDSGGKVVAVTAVRSQPPFDSAALETARSWTFRPAEGPNAPPSTYAYLVFVFRQPTVGGGAVSPR